MTIFESGVRVYDDGERYCLLCDSPCCSFETYCSPKCWVKGTGVDLKPGDIVYFRVNPDHSAEEAASRWMEVTNLSDDGSCVYIKGQHMPFWMRLGVKRDYVSTRAPKTGDLAMQYITQKVRDQDGDVHLARISV